MTPDVSWPRDSEGGRATGKDEIRAYWRRQWAQFDPSVEPLATISESESKVRIRVHQLVKSLQGDVLSDTEVFHVITVENGLIAAMDLADEANSDSGQAPPSRMVPDHTHRSA